MMDVLNVVTVAAEGAWNGVTSDMMSDIFSEIKSLLPIVAPAVIGFIGFRKGWSFLKGQLKGA